MQSTRLFSSLWNSLLPKSLLKHIDIEEYKVTEFVNSIPACNASLKLLDIGAGDLRFKRIMEAKGYTYLSLEIVETTLEQGVLTSYDFISDEKSFPVPDSFADCIICIQVLEHVTNPFDFFKEISRIAKSGGTIFLTTNFLFPVHYSPRDGFRFTPDSILNLCNDSNLLLDSIETRGGYFAILAKSTLEAPEIFVNWCMNSSKVLYSQLGSDFQAISFSWRLILSPFAIVLKYSTFVFAGFFALLDRFIPSKRYTLGYQCVLKKR
jgi:SAM-dependent methyltransferase